MHGGHGVNNEYRENLEEENDPAIFTTTYEDVMEANKLGAFIYFTCQGHLFMQAGEEYGRTKFGDGNSYRSHPEINMMRWEQTVEFAGKVAAVVATGGAAGGALAGVAHSI